MATIDETGTTHHQPRLLTFSGMCGALATIVATVETMTSAFGESDYANMAGWVLRIPGDRMSVYRTAETPAMPDTPVGWWVVGYERDHVDVLVDAVSRHGYVEVRERFR
jgi:hypothetical protein